MWSSSIAPPKILSRSFVSVGVSSLVKDCLKSVKLYDDIAGFTGECKNNMGTAAGVHILETNIRKSYMR